AGPDPLLAALRLGRGVRRGSIRGPRRRLRGGGPGPRRRAEAQVIWSAAEGLAMNQADVFHRAGCDPPHDQAVRRIFADWLNERDDPRGLFIQVQFALADLPEDDETRSGLKRCEQQLLARHRREWAGPLPSFVEQYEFVRGFVERVTLTGAAFLA